MIYLDNSATTRISKEALETYLAVSQGDFGNPSSLHAMGQEAASHLKGARKAILQTLGDPGTGTLLFTSGGTEGNNLAILGRAHAKPRFRGKTILTSAGEHASVKMPLEELSAEGFRIVEIPTLGGVLDLDALENAATRDVILASFMLVNNETGAVYNIPEAAAILKRNCPDAILHVDATQGYLKVPCSVKNLGCQMVTVSSHKIEGPKGMGALWVDPGVVKNKGLVPLLLGGGQEGGLRSGTENLPGAAAFGRAAEIGFARFDEHRTELTALRKRLLDRIASDPALHEIRVNLPPVPAPHILSLTLPRIKSETMLHALSARGIYVSSGSACSSHGKHGTSALIAFGLSERDADATVRVSLSHTNTPDEIDLFADALGEEVARLARF